jgi:hypothetical protein
MAALLVKGANDMILSFFTILHQVQNFMGVRSVISQGSASPAASGAAVLARLSNISKISHHPSQMREKLSLRNFDTGMPILVLRDDSTS